MPGSRCRFAVSLVLLSITSTTTAQELLRTPIADAADGTAAMGGAAYVGTSNYIGESTRYDQVPLFLYEGDVVFAHGNTLGFRLLRNDFFAFGPVARARLDSVNAEDVPALTGLSERKSTIEAGLTTALMTRFGELHVTAVRDMANRHDGEELDVSYRLPLAFDRWSLTPWASYRMFDAKLTNYYYGVGNDEIAPGRPAYLPGKAESIAYGLNTSYSFGDQLVVFANVAVEQMDDVVAASPITESSNNVRGFAGASWAFGGEPPPPRVRDQEYKGPPLWSWRVHWAYQLKHNIFPLAMSGIVTPSRLTPGIVPTQAGFTLSRVLRTGERADLMARAGWFRHFEEPFQDDFNSYTISMASVLKGYENYTDKVKFRWGAGFGLSYVESYPGQEVQLFINRRVDASRLLVYLELTVDFALDRLIKWDRLEGCFIGSIITHRSGAFGNSEVLGGVNGGADWGGIHVECRR